MQHFKVQINLVFLLCLLAATSSAQILSTAKDAVEDGIALTELTLQANDLLFVTTTVYTKSETLKAQLDDLEKLVKDPRITRYMSSTSQLEIITRIQVNSMKVKLYGNALSYMLKAIKKNLEKQSIAVTTKNTLAVQDAVQSTTEAITDKTSALAGTTDLSGTKRKLTLFSSDAELRSKMVQATTYIEGQMPKVNKINLQLDEMNAEVAGLRGALRASVGMQALYIMSLAPRVGSVK